MTTPDEPDSKPAGELGPMPAPKTDDELRAEGMAPEPRLAGQERPAVDPPKPVAISFWLWIAGGVIFFGGYLLTLLGKRQIIDDFVKTNKDPNITPEMIESGTTTLLWMLVVGSLVFAVLFALFAYKAREGTRSARTVLTALIAVVLVFQLLLQLASVITLAGTLLAIVAVVLMYLPSVGDYFPKVSRKPAKRR